MKNPYSELMTIKKPVCTPAQTALQQSLIELMQIQPHETISVKALCQHAFVARSTFYTYYQDIDEILKEIEDNLVYDLIRLNQNLMNRGIHKKEDLSFYSDTLDFIQAHKVPIYTLLVSSPDYRFIDKWKKAIKYHFWERLFKTKQPPNIGLILEEVASVVITSYSYWLTHPYELDTDGIYSIVSAVLKTLDVEL